MKGAMSNWGKEWGGERRKGTKNFFKNCAP